MMVQTFFNFGESRLKLSQSTIQVLKNFATIEQSLLVTTGNILKTESQQCNITGRAILEDSFPTQFGIHDLSRFLGIISLFRNPELNFGDRSMTIEEGNVKLRYVYADEDSVLIPKSPDAPKTDGVCCKFDITQQDITSLQKAAGVIATEDFTIQVKSSKVSVLVHDRKNQSSDEYRLDLPTAESTVTDASWSTKIELLKMFPSNYTAEVHKRANGKFSLHFFNDKFNYWIATTQQMKG